MPHTPEPVRFARCESCSGTFGSPVTFPATIAGAVAHADSHVHTAAVALSGPIS